MITLIYHKIIGNLVYKVKITLFKSIPKSI